MYELIGRGVVRFAVFYVRRRYRRQIRLGVGVAAAALAVAVALGSRNVREG
jgi:hypothetical protein